MTQMYWRVPADTWRRLPDDDPNKEVFSNHMLQTLVDRSRSELGVVLEKTTAKYQLVNIGQ